MKTRVTTDRTLKPDSLSFPLVWVLLFLSTGYLLMAQGPMTNGGNHDGLIQPDQEHSWTFTATAGDSIILRVGELNDISNFDPELRLYGPGDVLLAARSSSRVTELTRTVISSGTYTVVVADGGPSGGGSGTYRLHLAIVPASFVVADDGGPLTNGGNHDGMIDAGDLDLWTFSATEGERVILRIADVSGTGNFEPWIRLYDPDGVVIGLAEHDYVSEVDVTVTNSGTFTVIVSDGGGVTLWQTGDYRLHFMKIPGNIILADNGGVLSNGGNHDGSIELGDLDPWSFQARAGDSLVLRIVDVSGNSNFEPSIRLFGPAGTLLESAEPEYVGEIALTAPEAGTYVVVVGDGGGVTRWQTGDYRLHFAKIPGSFEVADDGGPLGNLLEETGETQQGDLDLWSFQANAGESITLDGSELSDVNGFEMWFRLYGPDGTLIHSQSGSSGVSFSQLIAVPGTYTLLISDKGANLRGSGAYRLALSVTKPPLILIPGIAGSHLTGGLYTGAGGNGLYLWPTVRPDKISALHLTQGAQDVQAVGVVKEFDLARDILVPFTKPIYGPFLTYLESQGFVEFDLADDPTRLTSNFMLQQKWVRKPSLFTFPYDWRLDNTAHIATLRTYISRVRQLHGGAKINVVAHSMGGLLLRRYMLDYGTDDLNLVVTVGTPVWGAPQGIFRLLTGTFFGANFNAPVDWLNHEALKPVMWSFPAVAQLLPSNYYQLNGGALLFSEVGWDFNRNGDNYEIYDPVSYIEMMTEQARKERSAFNPILVNQAFHTVAQSDWSGGSLEPRVLQISGHKRVLGFFETTTIFVMARSGAWWTSLNPGGVNSTVLDYNRLDPFYGRGDGTVPLLSAERFPIYHAPNTTEQRIVGGDEADHNGMLSENSTVWAMIHDFLLHGQLLGSYASSQSGGGSAESTGSGLMRVSILVKGESYVKIRNSTGEANTKLSEAAALQVPRVSIGYGQNSVLIECVSTEILEVLRDDDGQPSDPLEIEVVLSDANGDPTDVKRFRFHPDRFNWKAEVSLPDSVVLLIDSDEDSVFEPEESVPATFSGSGPSLDTTNPTITLNLVRAGPEISLDLAGTDDSGTDPALYYSLNSGPVREYESPMLLPAAEPARLKAFSEDSMGNTSGVIETEIQPELSANGDGLGRVTVSWPVAQAFVLEKANDPNGPWASAEAAIVRDGMIERATIVVTEAPTFFRLRAVPIQR